MEYCHACAFAELIAFSEDKIANIEEQTPVFKLSHLVPLYRDGLAQLGVPSLYMHSTSLKDRILTNFPELQAYKSGHDLMIIAVYRAGYVWS